MVLDVCPPLPSPPEVVGWRWSAPPLWAAPRPRRATERDDQALFGIVQGGIERALRAESAGSTVALDFDGYGIGGLSVGRDAGRDAAGARRRRGSSCRPTGPAT